MVGVWVYWEVGYGSQGVFAYDMMLSAYFVNCLTLRSTPFFLLGCYGTVGKKVMVVVRGREAVEFMDFVELWGYISSFNVSLNQISTIDTFL